MIALIMIIARIANILYILPQIMQKKKEKILEMTFNMPHLNVHKSKYLKDWFNYTL